jgi:hypothetical protein
MISFPSGEREGIRREKVKTRRKKKERCDKG